MQNRTVSAPRGIRVGCSGWVYKHWKGVFYPEHLSQKRWFEFYAGEFDTVEINASFYRLPTAKTFDKWREQAPQHFIYAVKANRFITHMKKLKGVKGAVDNFLKRAEHLQEALGPILFQLPANLHKNAQRLQAFLKLLPRDHEHAFEFRSRDWYDEEIFDLLDKHGAGLVVHDMTGSVAPVRATGKLAYLRLHGTRGKYHGRYVRPQLRDWAKWLLNERRKGRNAYAYFNNDIGGHAVEDERALSS